jgi:hypothetical protein
VIAVFLFVMHVGVLAALARHARLRLWPRIRQGGEPPRARGLVLFLSTLKGDEASSTRANLGAGLGGLDAFRTRFERCPWRMPLGDLSPAPA